MTAPARTESDPPPLVDPEAFFKSPAALAKDPLLSLERKLELLERWEFTVNARLSAGDEGMPVGAQREAKDSELVRAIDAARKSLLPLSAGMKRR